MGIIKWLFGDKKQIDDIKSVDKHFDGKQKIPRYKEGDTVFVYEGFTKKVEKGRIVQDAKFLDYFNKPDYYYGVMTETRDSSSNKECIGSGDKIRKPRGNELLQFYREDESVWADHDPRVKLVHGQLGI